MTLKSDNLYKKLIEELNSGKWQQGDRLPSMRELATRHGASLRKTHAVMKLLEEQNLVTTGARKRGTFVGGDSCMTGAKKALNRISNTVLVLSSETIHTYINWTQHSLKELTDNLSDAGLTVEHRQMPTKPEQLQEMLHNPGKHVKCIVMIPCGTTGQMLYNNRDILLNVAVDVFCYQFGNFPHDRLNCHIVSVDNARDGMRTAEFLLNRGYSKFTFVHERHNSEWQQLRFEEFQLRLKREQLTVNTLLASDEWLEESLKIAEKRDPNHVFVCVTDSYPAKMADAFEKQDLKLGKDFKTFSFNDDSLAEQYNLTTMRPPVRKIGCFLAEFIAKQLSEQNDDRRLTYKLCSELIERQSC